MSNANLARLATLALGLSLPAAAFAADPHAGPPWKELGSQIVNFCLYLGLIVYLAKKPVQSYFEARRADVTASMEAAKKAAAEAELRLAETKAKMDALDAEKAAILAEFRELGEAERRRIVAQAEADATRIVRDAELAAERDARQAKAALEAKMVDLALGKASEQLASRMDAGAQARLIDNGIDALARAAG